MYQSLRSRFAGNPNVASSLHTPRPHRSRSQSSRVPVALAAALLLPSSALFAQNAAGAWSAKEVLATESYAKPPADIERLVSAPRQNNISLTNLSPDRKYFLKAQSEGMPSVQTFGKPHIYFAGLQVDPKANRARTLTTRGSVGLTVIDANTGKTRDLEVPKGATVTAPVWSPSGTQLAYIANFESYSAPYIADVATGKSRRLGTANLLATLVTAIDWTMDGTKVMAVVIPSPRMAEPVRPAIETGPQVRMTMGKKISTRNYASLLMDPHDKAQMEYFITGQLVMLDAKSGAQTKVGAPTMFNGVDMSPDGKAFRVTILQKPFSYVVPMTNFAQTEEIWDASGKKIIELSKRPLSELEPADTNATPGAGGRGGAAGAAQDTTWRSVGWMPDGVGLYYIKQDPAPAGRGGANNDSASPGAGSGAVSAPAGGRGAGGAPRMDRVYAWLPPFDQSSRKEIFTSNQRLAGVLFSDDGKMMFAAENNAGTGNIYAVSLDAPTTRFNILRQRNYTASIGAGGGRGGAGGGGRGGADDSEAFYTNPGNMMTKRGKAGNQVALISSDGKYVYMEGTRYNRNWQTTAPKAFVEKIEIRTGTKTPVFEGATDMFETVGAPLDDDLNRVIVTREGPKTVPDSYIRDMKTGQLTKLTNNKDMTPEITNAIRKKIQVTRTDGIKFYVDLSLPANYQAGTRLPAMFWFYPYEYTEQAGYDRTLRTQNVNRYPAAGVRSMDFLTTQGYAVANFDPPIIGSANRMNDNYISDLQSNLLAVIDELDKQGFIDRQPLGLGGHSYGAFSTVNAMTHTPFFKAGIAGDGMYNRTLTPNGFQSERRDIWEAPQVYLEMSPFLEADKLSGALLMYHSIEDQNVGTDPISSVRMMQALMAQGKNAALYMYPYEDHGPATKETILDQWARWVAWLDIYVKNGSKDAPGKVTTIVP
ncbi:MAG: S9 family peptidase [Gemmatimonas sp.]